MAEALADWIVGGLSAGGFVALIYITFTFVRHSRNDTVSEYADLYQKMAEKCEKCERRLNEKDGEIDQLRREKDAEILELRQRINGLERELSQMGRSAAHLIERLDDKSSDKP